MQTPTPYTPEEEILAEMIAGAVMGKVYEIIDGEKSQQSEQD